MKKQKKSGPLRKVLIANRGEIALRIIRGCHEKGLKTVAIYSEADRWANYVSQAQESHFIGEAPASESYLRIDKILDVAKKSGADAIHPGYGFLAENSDFSEACRKAGIKFIGPPPEVIRKIGNKINARTLAEKNGIPVVPGLSQTVQQEDVAQFAQKFGYPVLLKAAGGGGGRGMRVVRKKSELGRAFREAATEGETSFGNPDLFVEKYMENPRHIEIQILADQKGNLIHLGERECSIQRRHQKLVEESPSTALDNRLRKKMGEAALRIARAVQYENAGTCEFLVEGRNFYFLEVNTRLQVEHPVTEMVTGIDLVQEQLSIAEGTKLSLRQQDVEVRGHAIEARICAEDPFENFAPSIGQVAAVQFPSGPFVRVDSDLRRKSEVSIFYDSLLAKVIAWGKTREEALDRMEQALREFKIVGIQTTIPFQLHLLQNRKFREGKIHTRFVEKEIHLEKVKTEHDLEAVLLATALEHQRREKIRPAYAGSTPLPLWIQEFRKSE
jgi:acetyl-CoA carboxylase biotin carboxylase subunit